MVQLLCNIVQKLKKIKHGTQQLYSQLCTQKNWGLVFKYNLHMSVCSTAIHNSRKVEKSSICPSIEEWINKIINIYTYKYTFICINIYNHIQFYSYIQLSIYSVGNNFTTGRNEVLLHDKSKKPNTKSLPCQISWVLFPGRGKPIKVQWSG